MNTAVPGTGQYAYVPHVESKPYFDIAHEFVLADRMFASQLDESFVAHQYIIAAQAHSSVDVPGTYWGCGGESGDAVSTITSQRTYGNPQRPCFDYETLGDEFDKAGLEWRFYTSKYTQPYSGLWSGYQAVRHIFYGRDWKRNVITPQKRFFLLMFAPASSPTLPGSRRSAPIPTIRRAARIWPVVGHVGRQCGRREQVLEDDGYLRAVG